MGFGDIFNDVANIGGGLIGKLDSNGDTDQAQADQQAALQSIMNIQDPDLQKLALQQYQSAGTLSPQMQQLMKQDQTSLASYQTNPNISSAQMGALAKLEQLGNGGLQPQDLAALQQAQTQSDQDAQAKSAQILQQSQMQGQGGQGNALAAQLINAQQGANRLNQSGQNITSQAAQRAAQNIAQAGNLAGSINNQQFGQAAQKAAAEDAINRFNTQNAQAVSNANTAATNYAQQYNLQNAQNLLNQNTGLANQENYYNTVTLPQTQYNDQMGLAQAKAGALTGQANNYLKNAQNTQQMWAGMGQGVGELGQDAFGSYGGGSSSTGGMGQPGQTGAYQSSNGQINPMDSAAGFMAHGGMIPEYMSDGGMFGEVNSIAPLAMMLMSKGGIVNMQQGGKVQGHAQVPGDDLRNDRKPAVLSPGEIVIPRSITQHPNAPSLAAAFVKAALGK